jgi:ABC-type oligopeptide transport system substrate-binding subunit
MGWAPDYMDPRSYINDLFTNRSTAANSAQVSDPQIQNWMEQADEETDPIKRELLFDRIQKRLIEEIYPWVWLFVKDNYIAKVSNLKDASYIPGLGINLYNCSFT